MTTGFSHPLSDGSSRKRGNMKFLLAIILTITLVTTSAPPKQKLNNTVANNSKSSKVTVQETKAETDAEATPIAQVTPPEPPKTGCDAYDDLLARYFGDSIRIAKAVMQAESGCNPASVGDGHLTYVQDGVTYGMSCGLFQIRFLPGRPSCEQMKNPSENIAYAGQMFAGQGWSPWSAFKNGSYLRHLR